MYQAQVLKRLSFKTARNKQPSVVTGENLATLQDAAVLTKQKKKERKKENYLIIYVAGLAIYSAISVSWWTTTLVTDMSGCCSFASLMACTRT